MAWGDFDNDGDLDVIVTGDAGGEVTALYRNNGDGTFAPMPVNLAGYRSSSVEWGDFDNDGYLDLLIIGLCADGVSRVYKNVEGTNFVEVMRFGLNYNGKVSWGDFNNDGKLDFAVCGAGIYNQVYQNLGGSRFARIATGMTQVYYGSVGWADFNRDGNLDLLVTGIGVSSGGGTYVYRNNGAGAFTLAWWAGPFEPGRWIDINNDGWPDIVVGNWPYQVTCVYQNNRLGSFTQVASLPIGPLAVADFNNDGWSDLLINNKVMQNTGTGTWVTVDTSLPDIGKSTLINNAFPGDFDNDGRLDLILSDSSYTTYLYRNITAQSNVPPEAPTGLQAIATRTNVVFSWSPAVDGNQGGGLTYNLRVGTSPGGFDVISPMSAPDGFRRVVRGGNAGSVTSYTLVGLKAGTIYYWSIQAVDNSFAGSPFAPEQSFVATALPTISSFTDQTVSQDSGPITLPFTVADLETPADKLVVTATSSNSQLVGPANLAITGTGTNRTLVITLEPGKIGTTIITVTVTDEDGGQSSRQFQLNVIPVNHPPVPRIIVSPLIELPGLSNLTAMTPVCDLATLILDGSQSSDPENAPLQYEWSWDIDLIPLGQGMVITNAFFPGTYGITLYVNDGTNSASATVWVDVITPADAVTLLGNLVKTSRLPRSVRFALLATLNAAQASFERCDRGAGINQLLALITQTRVLASRFDRGFADALTAAAEQIIQALASGSSPEKGPKP